MASDFFERQDQARRNSTKLVFLMILAVAGIVISVHVGIVLVVWFSADDLALVQEMGFRGLLLQRDMFLGIAGTVAVIVTGGSLYKLARLRGGGARIAERLGGRRLDPGSRDADERKVLNVVEEMAIASGVPVPPVYLLEGERSINAFAAGYETGDAVIGVTEGAIRLLDRDELQGVIAHEFSHILNGDMRLNIRLIGVIHGILLLGLMGQVLLRGGAVRRRRRSKDDNALVMAGLVLFVVGYVGTFFGNLIKAAISREREYLADASAVQFTRDPSGIAGALKKLGGLSQGSRIEHPRAAELSHMYFGAGIANRLGGAFATHPPLKKRIARLDPSFDGTLEPVAFPGQGSGGSDPDHFGVAGFGAPGEGQATPEPGTSGAGTGAGSEAGAGPGAEAGPPGPLAPSRTAAGAGGEPPEERPAEAPDGDPGTVSLDDALARIGEPTPEHLAYVRELLARVPQALKEAARKPEGARAVVHALILDRDPDVLAEQRSILEARSGPEGRERVRELEPHLDGLDVNARLPLLELAVGTLRGLSEEELDDFSATLEALAEADDRLEIFEWAAGSLVIHHLRQERAGGRRSRYTNLRALSGPLEVLLSALAHAGTSDEDEARGALQKGAAVFPSAPELGLLSGDACGPRALEAALEELANLVPQLKRQVLEASARTIAADRVVTTSEGELFRVVGEWLDCPVPPLLPGQKVA